MEEDIKILEQFLTGNKYCEDCKEKCVDCYIEYEEVQAVARLIKGYRELEKENKLLKKVDSVVENIDTEKLILKIEEDDSIPKSKIMKLKHELEEEYISLGKNKTEPSLYAMMGINFAISELEKLMEGK